MDIIYLTSSSLLFPIFYYFEWYYSELYVDLFAGMSMS